MKKIILTLFVLGFGLINAQSNYTDMPGKWRIGGNMGAIWETTQMKAVPGLGGGFTIEKILYRHADAPIGFSLGFRYLGGRTFGYSANPFYGIQNNKALNGTYDSTINYAKSPGYTYYSYKTFIQEGNLELKMNFPRLEQKTGIIFHVWGGIGICKYKTWVDALDKNGNMYDFSSFNAQAVSKSDLSRVLDGNYETLAEGSSSSGNYCIIPSIGAGLGYRLGRGVALVFEYKMSFPGTNLLDGMQYNNNNQVIAANQYYNYASAGLVFTIYGKRNQTQPNTTTTNTNNYTNPTNANPVYTNPTNTNPVYTNPNTTVNNTTVYNNQQPIVYPPNIIITYPANNYYSPSDYTTVNATVQNINSPQQLLISQNGYPIQHFTFNPYNNTLHFQTFLAQGNNNFVITATNQGGTVSQGVSIFFGVGQQQYNPNYNTNTNVVNPVNGYPNNNNNNNNVNTVNPINNNNTVNTVNPINNNNTVNTVNPVNPVNNGTNNTVNPVNTNPNNTVNPVNPVTTNTVTTHNNVNPYNSLTNNEVVSTNTNSVVTNNNTVINNTVHNGIAFGKKPFVSFINPSVYPDQETNPIYNVSASIQNVSNSSGVSVTVNGNSFSQFNFNTSSGVVNFGAPLQQGYNTITITGTNTNGTDTKSAIINYKPVGRPPKVTITNPASSPYASSQSSVILSGFVYNVNSSADITVTSNGGPNTFNYNMSTHTIDVPINLYSSSTQVNISATNSFGNDAQNMTVIYKKIVINPNIDTTVTSTTNTNTTTTNSAGGMNAVHNKPEITVLSPTANPYFTNTGYISVSANVNLVLNVSDVTVTYGGQPVSVTYDLNSKHLNFTSPLKPGMNTFIIEAKNTRGTESQSVNVSYTPINVNTNTSTVNGNNLSVGNNTNNTNNNNSSNTNSSNTNSGGPSYNHGGWNSTGIFNTTNTNTGGNQTSAPPRNQFNTNNNSGNTKPPQNNNQQAPKLNSGGNLNQGKPVNTTPVKIKPK